MDNRKRAYIYFILSGIIFGLILFLSSSPKIPPIKTPELSEEEIIERIKNSPYIFLVISISITIFVAGIINIFIFLTRKLKRKPIWETNIQPHPWGPTLDKSAVLIFLVVSAIFSSQIIGEYMGGKINYTSQRLLLGLLLNLLLEITTIILVITFIYPRYIRFSLQSKHLYTSFRIYTALIVILLAIQILTEIILKSFNISPEPTLVVFLLTQLKNPFVLILLITQIIISGPIAEELFFRGFIFRLLRSKQNFWIASIISSAIFALLHQNAYNFIPLLLLSIYLSYIYEKTDSISYPILLHALHNFLNVILLFVQKDLIF